MKVEIQKIAHDRNIFNKKKLVNDTNFKICILCIKAKELLEVY